MKFKTKEELVEDNESIGGKNYNYDAKFNIYSYDSGYKSGITDSFDSFKERIEFYLNWRTVADNVIIEECINKNPDVGQKWSESGLTYRSWNVWLFNYCFNDVIE